MKRTAATLALLATLVSSSLAVGQGPPPQFRPPFKLGPTINRTGDDGAPSVVLKGLKMYWSARATVNGPKDIWSATRGSVLAPWINPIHETGLSTGWQDGAVFVSGDDLEAWITSTRTGGLGQDDIWYYSRSNTSQPWGAPVNLNVNGIYSDTDASVRNDGLEMFWSASNGTAFLIYSATRTSRASTVWSTPQPVPAPVNQGCIDHSPAISPDGLSLIIATDRWPQRCQSSNMMLTTRPSFQTQFTGATTLTALNSANSEKNGQWGPDGFSFYYMYNTTLTNNAIWRADRTFPICLFTGVTEVGAVRTVKIGASFSVAARRDPGNVGIVAGSLALIPPTPMPPPLQGNLELNPGFLLGPPLVGIMGPTGRVTWNLTVPNLKVLIGTRVHFQCAGQANNIIYLSAAATVSIV